MKATIIAIAAIALLGGPLSPASARQGFTTVSAQSAPCTNASLNGDYGFLKVGKTPEGPLNAIGHVTFDGQGNFLGQGQTFDINGKFSINPPGGTGTYSINPDCSGTQKDPTGRVAAHLMVIHDGSQGLEVTMTPGRNIPVHLERIFDAPNPDSDAAARCSNATLKGIYGYQRNGQTGQGALTAVGAATFDGQGNETVAEETIAISGNYSTVTNQVFTYSIKPDCTGVQTSASGEDVLLLIVHDGSQVLGMSMIPETNVAIHYERVADPPSGASGGVRRPCREFDRTP
jgi:hypothetical protein